MNFLINYKSCIIDKQQLPARSSSRRRSHKGKDLGKRRSYEGQIDHVSRGLNLHISGKPRKKIMYRNSEIAFFLLSHRILIGSFVSVSTVSSLFANESLLSGFPSSHRRHRLAKLTCPMVAVADLAKIYLIIYLSRNVTSVRKAIDILRREKERHV